MLKKNISIMKIIPGLCGQSFSTTSSMSAAPSFLLHIRDTWVHMSGSNTVSMEDPIGYPIWSKEQHLVPAKLSTQTYLFLDGFVHVYLVQAFI